MSTIRSILITPRLMPTPIAPPTKPAPPPVKPAIPAPIPATPRPAVVPPIPEPKPDDAPCRRPGPCTNP